jgi:hypothetical protein
MNVGVLLQYARDFQHDARAGQAVAILLEWLATHHVNPATGVWGAVDVADPRWRSQAVQAAYHWWPLFFYDGIQPPHLERAIDTVLATQNPRGGFGWGGYRGDLCAARGCSFGVQWEARGKRDLGAVD